MKRVRLAVYLATERPIRGMQSMTACLLARSARIYGLLLCHFVVVGVCIHYGRSAYTAVCRLQGLHPW